MNGNIVRLYQGKYSFQTFYDIDVFSVLSDYHMQGANIVHLIDLDGALNPNNKQTKLIKHLLRDTDFNLQIGGGIRSRQDIDTLLECGAKRIVIGSLSINSTSKVIKWLREYGKDIIVLAVDIKIHDNRYKEVVFNAWQDNTGISLEDLISKFIMKELKYVLCTDVSKDGTLCGPNLTLYHEISQFFKNIHFQSSGGISSIKDIISIKQSGVKDVIIGRALLEKKFSLKEAISCWQNE